MLFLLWKVTILCKCKMLEVHVMQQGWIDIKYQQVNNDNSIKLRQTHQYLCSSFILTIVVIIYGSKVNCKIFCLSIYLCLNPRTKFEGFEGYNIFIVCALCVYIIVCAKTQTYF